MVITLDSRVEVVLGDVKNKTAKIKTNLGIETVGDLLGHFPRRYLETGRLTRLSELRPGQLLTVVGEIASSRLVDYRDRRSGRTAYRLETVLRTDGPSLKMTFFAKNVGVAHWQRDTYRVGRRGIFVGQASRFNDAWQLTNPAADLLAAAGDEADGGGVGVAGTPRELPPLYPIYPLTKGVLTWDLQKAIGFALSVVEPFVDVLPAGVRDTYDLIDADTAYAWVHAPDSREQVHRAHRHFRFAEALVTQVVLARRRRAARGQGARARLGTDDGLLAAFDARLPFTLTPGQVSVGAEIDADLAQPHPMNRLLQGEVGSGKTLVALRAMLRVVDSGGQAALLAPTEVLAQQHHRSITALLGELAGGGMFGGTSVELLTGSMTKTQRTEPLSRIVTGEAGIVIGTHALLEDTVMFHDLGLVVVDEQHRFGVEQRAALTDKAGSPPHVLVMTATPIPRTVAMTVFGDLETSTLRELPAGRAAIQTNVVNLVDHPGWIERAWQRVREEVEAGHQVYVVCPRISGDEQEQGERDQIDPVDPDSDAGGAGAAGGERPALAAVEEVVAQLAAGPLAGVRLAALHGRLPADAKDAVMRSFADGLIDVLVSTTVIEVGVDVPNATAMVVLDADRFGVSQLHQLRGRVGRGGLPGLCLLVSSAPEGSPARDRLAAVASTTDGFELSRLDLELRREGDVLGASQSGWRSSLQNLRVLRDEQTIVEAREAAEALLDDDAALTPHPVLAAAVADLEARAEAEFVDKS